MLVLLWFLAGAAAQAQDCTNCSASTDFRCSNEGLTSIPDCLPSTTTLLDLFNNSISSLTADSFAHIPNLQDLYLGSNKIQSLPSDVFVNVPDLRNLDLEGNLLTALPSDVFSYVPKLERLTLANNDIQEIPSDLFALNTDLFSLNIGGNLVSALPEAVFASLTKLGQLFLHNNQLTDLQDNLFLSNVDLTYLDASGNLLPELNELTFQTLTNLWQLLLHGNRITQIQHPATFHFNLRLNMLSLDSNLMTTLDDSKLSQLSNLYVYLENNPWNCDCVITAMMTNFAKRNVSLYQDPVCASPPELAGLPWQNMSAIITCP